MKPYTKSDDSILLLGLFFRNSMDQIFWSTNRLGTYQKKKINIILKPIFDIYIDVLLKYYYQYQYIYIL